MAIKQNISIGRIEQIVAETEDGVKYIPVVLVSGETDTTPEVSVANFPAVQDVQLSGSIVPLNQPLPELGVGKVVIDTLLNAVSVAAGGSTGSINLNITNEKELWLAVSIDQQPWTLVSGVPWMVSDSYGSADTFFPRRQNETKTYLPTSPALSLSLGLSPTTSGLSVTTMAEAKQIMLPPFSGVSARIVNNSAATATVTVKAIRVWR